ncbi:MAG: xanthine dehydrogenase family protein subunit M [bacterium]|nr:xanthine dehydrogenase family protein subunit M [bacterium]
MIPHPLSYHVPRSVEEAISLLESYGEDAKLLAGGHSLLPLIKLRLAETAHLIDLGRIEGLAYVRQIADTIHIGAMTTHSELAGSELLAQKQALLPRAAIQIGDVQVRNHGTLGGSIAHADPAADLVPVLLALEAEMLIRGPAGERTVAAADLFEFMFTTTLEDGEILVEVRVPVATETSRCTYEKLPHKASHLAVVGVAAQIELSADGRCERARLALTGLAPVPFRALAAEESLRGKALSQDSIAAAAQRVTDGVDPLSDFYAPADYRLHLARVYAARALTSLAR